MSRGIARTAFSVAEKALGRRLFWRLGRAIYLHARRDFGSEITTSGERDLQVNLGRLTRPLTVFDVGANLGQWSTSLLQVCRDDLDLTCFEPSPTTFLELSRRVPSARHVQAAVSDFEGEAEFSIVGETAGTNTLGRTAGVGTILVPVTTVAAYADRHGVEVIDLLKIDAEGFDASVIRGALPLLRTGRIGVVQFEYNSQWTASRAYLGDVADLIADLPYTLGKVVPGGIELYEEWRPELERFFEANYALVRDDMRDALNAWPVRFDVSNTLA